mmetsp:Transcript_18736/g.58890  ORF Transcript_18736/g.58890 Transcript_18736/m.58890 type:complete len:368 (-) Transcript_18736:319-1422(-)
MARRRPSSPHPRGVPLPVQDVETSIEQAAQTIANADALLICSGAGMGVDCGFGTYQGRYAGVWGPLHALCMDYQQMSDPDWFESDPRFAWAYWASTFRSYMSTTPHAGYTILREWGERMAHGYFSVTSNIDGHWERVISPERVYEVHGAITHLQRVDDDGTDPVWRACIDEMEKLNVPEWDLRAGDEVEMRVAARGQWGPWGPALVGSDGFSVVATSDGQRLTAHAVRRPGGVDLLRVPEDAELPRCGGKGSLARPNVLLFGDPKLNTTRIDRQQEGFRTWKKLLPSDIRLAVVEVGAGTTIPTIRDSAEDAVSDFPNATLVRVNLDDGQVGRKFGGRSVAVCGLGALEALTRIDAALHQVSQQAGS